MKASLSKDVRIKKDENYSLLTDIQREIQARVQAEYQSQTKALHVENDGFRELEKAFIEQAKYILVKLIPQHTPIKVTVQVGKGSTILRDHEGTIQKPFYMSDGYFNMIDPTYNDGKPFTIGFSCLQSIEAYENSK
jgi:hypothetical protein